MNTRLLDVVEKQLLYIIVLIQKSPYFTVYQKHDKIKLKIFKINKPQAVPILCMLISFVSNASFCMAYQPLQIQFIFINLRHTFHIIDNEDYLFVGLCFGLQRTAQCRMQDTSDKPLMGCAMFYYPSVRCDVIIDECSCVLLHQ